MSGCLYILNFPNGKSYIGISKWGAQKRFAKHCESVRCGSKFAAHNAIRKFGPENTAVKTLVIADWPYLKALEKQAIAAFSTKAPDGYNMTDGGDGTIGHIHSAESRLRMSAAHIGKPLPPETKAKMSLAAKGKPKTKEHAANIGASRKGTQLSTEHRKKISVAHTGKRLTPEQRERISENLTGRPMSEKTRLTLIALNTGKLKSKESIAKRTAARAANRAARLAQAQA